MNESYFNNTGHRVSFQSLVHQRISFHQKLDKYFLDPRKQRATSSYSHRSFTTRPTSSLDDQITILKQHRIASTERIRRARLERPKTAVNHATKITFNVNVTDVDDTILNIRPEIVMEKKPVDNTKRQTYGLKVAVADFSQKVLDNIGMNITTFTDSENESEETQKPRNSRMLSSTYTAAYSNKILTAMEKFKRAIKTINMMLKATMTNAEQSKKHEQKYLTFTDIKSDVEEDTVQPTFTELTFNLSDYKAKREAKFSAEAINIMKRHQSLRSEENIHFVIMALTSTVEAFGEFPINMQEAIVKHGWYEKFGPKRVIIRQSHAAQNFYFIISGKTMVVVARKHNMSGESYGETVAFLKKGNSFGELALMYGGKRSASVVCYDEVELLSVSREDFVEIFMNLSTDTEPKHIEFLRSVPILEGWPIECLPYDDPRICLFTYFRKGTVLCRDSVTSEWVYIVCSGTCKVIKSMNEVITNGYKVDRNSGKIICRYANSDNTKKKTQIVFIKLNSLHSGEVFGLESIAFGQLGSTTSVTFVSEGAECVAIEKKFFAEHMSETYMKRLRYELQPFPIEDELRIKLQNYFEWKTFRKGFNFGYSKKVK